MHCFVFSLFHSEKNSLWFYDFSLGKRKMSEKEMFGSKSLNCLVCQKMVEEFEFAISKVDPNKKIATRTFRINSVGEQKGKVVSCLSKSLYIYFSNFIVERQDFINFGYYCCRKVIFNWRETAFNSLFYWRKKGAFQSILMWLGIPVVAELTMFNS